MLILAFLCVFTLTILPFLIYATIVILVEINKKSPSIPGRGLSLFASPFAQPYTPSSTGNKHTSSFITTSVYLTVLAASVIWLLYELTCYLDYFGQTIILSAVILSLLYPFYYWIVRRRRPDILHLLPLEQWKLISGINNPQNEMQLTDDLLFTVLGISLGLVPILFLIGWILFIVIDSM
jgi:hypothetical protein